ncbi:MAG: DUF982 domain-containing protein [Shinella sp.]|nr:DUF982 domain-containing protein [Shinella sp.]
MINLALDRLWEEAVVLERGRQVLRVQSTRDAAICLKNHWPLEEGPAKLKAVSACESVIDGTASPDTARAAFIEAAKEADFQINSWTGD